MTVKLSDRAREEAIVSVTNLAKRPGGAKMEDFRGALEMTDGQIRGVIANAKLVREGSKKYATYVAPAGAREKRAAPPAKKTPVVLANKPRKVSAKKRGAKPLVGKTPVKSPKPLPAKKPAKRKRGAKK